MTTARDFIEDAYGETLKALFEKFYETYVVAASDDSGKQEAEQHFSAGVSLAASVRDRALALLPPTA